MGRLGNIARVDHTRRRSQPVLVVALTGCMLTVALLAASASRTSVFTEADGRGASNVRPSAPATTPPPPPPTGLLPDQKHGASTGLAALGVLGVVVVVLLAILVIVLLVMATRIALAALRRRDSSALRALQPDSMPDGSIRTDAVAQALADLQRAVVEGSPRAGIIAAWVWLERLAGDSGVLLRPSETPAELTIRMLDGLDVPGRYVLRLADLYREARFSAHPMAEADRTEAAHCLQVICGVPLNPATEQLTQ